MNFIKKKTMQLMDWYIIRNYSEEYIHRDMIKDEIARRIESAEVRLNAIRDRQERERIQTEKTKFAIVEDGYVAEITRLEKIVEDVLTMRKELEDMHYRIVRRARELSLITAENKHEGNKIISNVSASIGKLDVIGRNTSELVKEIKESENEDNGALRLK